MQVPGTGMDFRSPQIRLLIVAALLGLWTAAAAARLADLQLARYTDFLTRAERQQQRIVEISPKRADILDRNLHESAMSTSLDSCFAVPAEIVDKALVARLLGPVLGLPADEMATRLSSSRSFAWIARKLPPATVARIRQLNLRGIYFQKENQRFYPKRDLAAAVLGFVDIDEKGLGGIEYQLDARIRSKASRMLILTDAHNRWYESTDKAPEAGFSVTLTIDENIQFVAEKELATAIEQTHAKAGTVLVEDPSNGEILAMASWPRFNPNAAGGSRPEARMNRAVGALYEPGSVFKIVTLSAAIDQGIIRPDEVVDCQNGAIYIAGHRIRDHKPYGLLTVSQILAHSSDVGAIKIGLRLGAPKFFQYIRAYGFGELTGIDLPGENRGLLRRVENWTPVSVGSISMGQEVGVTPLQMINAVSAIANGGLLYRPHVVLALRRGAQVEQEPQPAPRRVVRETTAATMRAMLEGVVLNGTGTKAQLNGYTSAGKTGTAQKIDPATGRYSATQLIASFVGFAPINNPAMTILVQLDSPVGLHEGGSVAAPVFKRVAEQVLSYLNVPRDIPVSPATLRAARRSHAPEDADISDFEPGQFTPVGSSDSAQAGPISAAALPISASAPTVELAEGAGISIPDLTGKTVRQVTEICVQLGLNPVLVGAGTGREQSPPAGTTVRPGASVIFHFGRPAATPARLRTQARIRKGAAR